MTCTALCLSTVEVSTQRSLIYGSITVKWSIEQQTFNSDYLGLYYSTDPLTYGKNNSLWWTSTNSTKSGTVQTNLQSPNGVMEYRYIGNGGKTVLARSAEIIVALQPYTIDVNPFITNKRWTISWTCPKSKNGTQWIGLFRIGDERTAPLMRFLASKSDENVAVDVPTAASSGLYEFRYYTDDILQTYSSALMIGDATSDVQILVPRNSTVFGGALTVGWNVVHAEPHDWIGLFSIDEKPSLETALFYQYTKGKLQGTVHSTAPSHLPPNSQIVWHYMSNNMVVASSTPIRVSPINVKCSTKIKTAIKHIVVIEQENHSFDSFFGNYCTAETGSRPVCTSGPSCCEKSPSYVNQYKPRILDDFENKDFCPPHSAECEICMTNQMTMSNYVQNCSCANVRNWAVAKEETLPIYFEYAKKYAIADQWYQSGVGASSMNDMYLARANMVFIDNAVVPDTVGTACYSQSKKKLFSDPTVADLLLACNVSFGVYGEGYDQVKHSPNDTSMCYPHYYDASDYAFQYYHSLADNASIMFDYSMFAKHVASGKLPNVSLVRSLGTKSEHPGDSSLTDGMRFSKEIVDLITSSSYNEETLIVILQDESGGYFDHYAPITTNNIDGIAYGARLPVMVVGHFAKKSYVSHVPVEHSSLVKFIQWNFLEYDAHLQTRDSFVNNLHDLLDLV